MSELICGMNMPEDLLAVLRKYGMPEWCTAFKIECESPGDLLTFQYSSHQMVPGNKEGTFLDGTIETRKFNLVEVK